ncbi:hypothetical protein J2793_006768 [Paraburkholderia caledonica]|uniref:Uncharacterized protein n=1 Tax=Paraburkholderia caledonica TaxID=134536 RepID=A0AB73IMQ3_9BURK|nr:hypothetical protein [Paraburkholderia caledonica]
MATSKRRSVLWRLRLNCELQAPYFRLSKRSQAVTDTPSGKFVLVSDDDLVTGGSTVAQSRSCRLTDARYRPQLSSRHIACVER